MIFIQWLVAQKKRVLLFLLAITLIVYLPIVRGDYILDDDVSIIQNQDVQDLKHIPQIYANQQSKIIYNLTNEGFYRPNAEFCHALVNTLFGNKSTPHHLFSIVIHSLNVCLLFSFLCLLGFNTSAAFFAAATFAIHPINTEAVAYISELSYPLGLMFVLLSFIFYIQFRHTKKFYNSFFAIIAAVAALFSNEFGVLLIVVLVILEVYFQPAKTKLERSNLILLLLVLIICICFLAVQVNQKYSSLNTLASTSNAIYNETIVVRIITFFTLLPRYFGMLIMPLNQYYCKPDFAYSSLSFLGLGGLMILGALLYLFYSSYFNRRALMLAIGVFLVFLIPHSGILPLPVTYREHWLYFPFLGVAIAMAMGIHEASKNLQPVLFIFISIFLVAYSAKSFARNRQWSDAVRFYKNEIKYNKTSPRAYNDLAMALHQRKDYFSAINFYCEAIRVDNVYPQTHHNLASTYLQLNQVSNAIAEEYKALEIQPDFRNSLQALLEVYTLLHDEKRAVAFTQFIAQVDAGQTPNWNEIKENLHADTK